jgi:quercetin dioxygenase-like cupin family protein
VKLLIPGTENADVWNGYLRGGYATWQPGQDCELHSHDDAAEVFVILGGQCEFTVEDATFLVPAGQTVYVGPGEKHRLRVVGDQPMDMFLAVMPNHEPTHTFYDEEGRSVYRNRERPNRPDD